MKGISVFVMGCILLVVLLGCTTPTNTTIDTNTGTDNNFNPVVNNLDQFKIAKSGDSVSVHYTGKLLDGTIFDTSKKPGRTPLEFTIDDGGMIKGFNEAVKGMKVGETKTVTLPPEQAYGVEDPTKIVTFDANQFADFNTIVVGARVGGGSMQGIVTAKTDTNAIINFNHDLAGKSLVFEITLVSLNE